MKRLARPALGAVAIAALALSAMSPITASADPPPGRTVPTREFGNGPERNLDAAPPRELSTQAAVRGSDSVDLGLRHYGHSRDRGYPRQTQLPAPPENPADPSIRRGLVPYHGIAPKLNELQKRSDRVSAEIIGKSFQNRDLYLVTVTAPESSATAKRQTQMREKIENDPARAARDKEITRGYKTPIFVNGNIHGNEWEGADANLRVIETLATARDTATTDMLGRTRLYFNVTANPDGRVNERRQNGAGFDLNRDMVTASQPEARAMRQIMINTQPVVMLDLHGYVNGTLIEPTTPPHGQNYEYDLFIRNAYANGLGMEAAVNKLGYTFEKDGVHPPQIPFRDQQEGWDDWPPIFTPQYAPFQGAVASHTIEIPLRINNLENPPPPDDELKRRSRINTDILNTTVMSTLSFVQQRRSQLVADQIEVFRRGAAGEALRTPPVGWVPGFGPEDQYGTRFPRAYVIPTGRDQRSAVAAARLVDHLVANDVRVTRAVKDFRLGGTSYPAGSYVVDMHQPKRAMANVMLEAGLDITPKVDAMYDISAWSHAYLWGASVAAVQSADLRGVPTTPVNAAAPTGSVSGGGELALRLDDPKEITALNALLNEGVEVRWAGDGRVLLPASARAAAQRAAERYGVRFAAADGNGTAPVRKLTVAAAAGADETFSLQEMGYAVTPVSTAILNAGFDWTDVDVLYVSSGLDYSRLNATARGALDAFLARGGVVGRGATGANFNRAAGLLTATAVPGRGDANGVVSVTNSGGPLTAGAPNISFVFSPWWFTGLGSEVTVEQRYSAAPMIAGHWRPDPATGNGGQDQAAGQATIVRGVDERGTAVVLFGTEPLFRNHPKGMFAQVARSLQWTAITAAQRRTAR